MSAYGSLFERLNGEHLQRSGMSLEAAVKDSVAAHLGKMLSTRVGSVQTLPDYGLPDLNNMSLSLHEALQQTRSSLATFIEAYEPRLTHVQVDSSSTQNNPLHLAFSITATLLVNEVPFPVYFNARLAEGKVSVK